MLRLIRPLYQWDTGQKLRLEEEDIRIDSVDFWQDNRDTVMTVAVDRDAMTVPVPNLLLQQDRPFIAYEMADGNTIRPFRFRVLSRPKPENYYYQEIEILKWKKVYDEIVNAVDAKLNELSSMYLRKDNTEAYTPVSNYNPATKKYVDDARPTAMTESQIDSIIGTGW